MRYCSGCGNPLNGGDTFCQHCGAALKSVVPVAEEIPVSQPSPAVVPSSDTEAIREEKEFLELTHRLLRWERKAWSIAGKVFLIMGIVFAALFFLIGVIIAAADASAEAAVGIAVMIVYAVVCGGMLITIGIINIITAGKIPQYTDTLYKDFRAAHKRCNSVGMIIFGYFFNTIAMVFYVINFVRMKSNKQLTQRILKRQGF